jgi:beta-lactamase class C
MSQFLSRRSFGIGLATVPLATSNAFSQSGNPGPLVEAAAREFMSASGTAGVAIGMVGPQGRHLFYFGSADPAAQTPVRADTLFEIGSLSKTFTVALAAIAAARGALKWEDAPGRHVPEVRGPGTDRLTLRDLATHATGGMPLQFPAEAKTWDEAAAWYRSWTPAGEPGAMRAYANPSIGLLGVATARAMKGEFAALMRQHVLAQLGLKDTVYSVPQAMMARYAKGQTRDGRPGRLSPGMLATEAYGLKTTAPDMLRWVEAQLGAASTPSDLRQALKATQAGWLKVGPMTQGLIWEWYAPPAATEALLEGNGEAMWMKPNAGMRLDGSAQPPAGAFVNKTGGTNGFGAYAAFMPEQRTGLVILANRNHAAPLRIALAQRLREAIGA